MHATGMDGLRSTLDMVQFLQTQQRMLAKPFQNILSDMAKISEVSHTCCAHLLDVFRQMDLTLLCNLRDKIAACTTWTHCTL